MRRQQHVIGQFHIRYVAGSGVAAPFVNSLHPSCKLALLNQVMQRRQQVFHAAHNAHIRRHILVDLSRIDIEVDHAGIFGVGAEIASHAVVEAHAQCDDHIGVKDRLIDIRLTVHTHHAQVERMMLIQHTDAQQGCGNRDAALFHKCLELIMGVGMFDALPG